MNGRLDCCSPVIFTYSRRLRVGRQGRKLFKRWLPYVPSTNSLQTRKAIARMLYFFYVLLFIHGLLRILFLVMTFKITWSLFYLVLFTLVSGYKEKKIYCDP